MQTGWAAGAGSEVNIAPNFGVVLEYLYTDLGNVSYNAPIAGLLGSTLRSTITQTFSGLA